MEDFISGRISVPASEDGLQIRIEILVKVFKDQIGKIVKVIDRTDRGFALEDEHGVQKFISNEELCTMIQLIEVDPKARS